MAASSSMHTLYDKHSSCSIYHTSKRLRIATLCNMQHNLKHTISHWQRRQSLSMHFLLTRVVVSRTMQYGSIFKSHILFQPAVFISKDSSIRKILNSEHKLVESAWPRQYQELLGDAFTGVVDFYL